MKKHLDPTPPVFHQPPMFNPLQGFPQPPVFHPSPSTEPRFKVSCKTYMAQDTSYMTNNVPNAYHMNIKAHEYKAIDMLSHFINNCNSAVLPSNPLRDEYLDEEDAEEGS